MRLVTQDHFVSHQLHRLWHTLHDLADAGWEAETEITEKAGILSISLEAANARVGPFRDFHRIVDACPKLHMLVCCFHNGGTSDAGEYVLIFRDGC